MYFHLRAILTPLLHFEKQQLTFLQALSQLYILDFYNPKFSLHFLFHQLMINPPDGSNIEYFEELVQF